MVKKKTVTRKKSARRKSSKPKAAAAANSTQPTEPEVEVSKPMTTQIELLRKITNKTVLGDTIRKPEEPTDLYKLFGVIYGYKLDRSDLGEFIKFKGDFVAHVLETGQEFRAPNAIIPVPMDDVLAQMYDNALEHMADPETGELPSGKQAQVQFAVVIGNKPSKSPTGYEWTVKPEMEMQENDAILALRRQVLGLEHQE